MKGGENMEKTFGERLKELRMELDMDQDEFGEIFNKSKSSISSYENNKRVPSLELVKKFAEYFNVTTDYLLGISDVRFSPDEKIKNALINDRELYYFWEETVKREDLKMLFRQTRDLSDEAIRSVVQFMQMIEKEHGGNK